MDQGLISGARPGRRISPVMVLPATNTIINIVVDHNLGSVPADVVWRFVCIQADQGYSAGQEIDARQMFYNGGAATMWVDASQAGFVVGATWNDSITINSRTGSINAPLTMSKWGLRCVILP